MNPDIPPRERIAAAAAVLLEARGVIRHMDASMHEDPQHDEHYAQ